MCLYFVGKICLPENQLDIEFNYTWIIQLIMYNDKLAINKIIVFEI